MLVNSRGETWADSTKCIVLICDECGEGMMLTDPEAIGRPGYTAFECRCGEKLTLADRLEEKTTELPTVPHAWKLPSQL